MFLSIGGKAGGKSGGKTLKNKENIGKHGGRFKELAKLGDLTVNYNGSDIDNIVIRSKMEGIYKIRKATHFKDVGDGFFTPCAPQDDDAIAMNIDDIHESKIVGPPVSFVSLAFSLCDMKFQL